MKKDTTARKAAPKTEVVNTVTVDVKKAEDNTITLNITVPWQQVDKARETVENELVKNIEVPGFRKGAAPKNIAKQKLDKSKLQEEILKRVLTESYNEVVQKEQLNPIVSPQIHVESFDEGTPLKYTAETAENPKVELKDYKEAVKKITAKTKIAVPGKEEQKPNMDEVIKAAMDTVDVKIPKVLVQQEANRLLSQLLDELKRLGVTLDQYIASRGKNADDLRVEYEEKAAQDLKLEFMLRSIADAENITVEAEDIQKALAGINDEKQRAAIAQNPYLVAAIIRQQKTLDFIANI